MAIKFRNNKVGVEKLKKQGKKSETFYVTVDSEEFQGVIRYVGTDASKDLQVGMRVYFGDGFTNATIKGTALCVMEDMNVVAIIDEEEQSQPQAQ